MRTALWHFPKNVKKLSALSLLWASSLILGESGALAESQTNPTATSDFDLDGRCVDVKDRHSVIPGATLVLYALVGADGRPEKIAQTVSDVSGKFEFSNLMPPSEQRVTGLKYVIIARRGDGPLASAYVWSASQDLPLIIPIGQATAALRGKTVDEEGNPIPGVQVEQLAALGQSIPGVPSTQSNDRGLYFLKGLPAIPENRSFALMLSHPDFPTTTVSVQKNPDVVTLQLESGSLVTGAVRDGLTNQPLDDVVVTAVPQNAQRREVHSRTDESGNFRFNVTPGNYDIVLEADETHVAPAIQNVVCAPGKNVTLDPLVASTGGWITGQVINTDTGKPMIFADDDQRIAVGFFGPSRPAGKVIRTHFLCTVDDEGRFRMRVAEGENFPYLCNIRGERNSWSTQKLPPVVVTRGEESEVIMNITPERTPEQKMDRARRILAALPMANDTRVDAIIDEFRKLNHTVDDTEVWCLLMQELVRIGAPAVLPLCREFEETDQQRMMRRLAFALRAIGDPRAVPTLIRVLPKTLQPPMSDYGLLVADPDLSAFMHKHDISDRDGQHFSFGRPVRETHQALVDLTGRNMSGRELATTKKSEDPRALAAAEKLYHEAARDWATWWEENWDKFDVDESFRDVRLPKYRPPDLSRLPKSLELTDDSKLGNRFHGAVLTPVGDGDLGATYFFDLDTQRSFTWPNDLEYATDQNALQAASEWARNQGADLMCVAKPTEEGEVISTLQLVGSQAWEIEPSAAENIETLVANGELPTGREIDHVLEHEFADDQPMKTQIGSSFLYLTKEQGLGMITVTDLVTEARDITGLFSTPQGVGFHRGVRFNVTTILR